MKNSERLIALLDKGRFDPNLLLVIADALEEEGNREAFWWRTLAAEGKRPARTRTWLVRGWRQLYHWVRIRPHITPRCPHWLTPEEFASLQNYNPHLPNKVVGIAAYYHKKSTAFRALVWALPKVF